MLAVKYSFFAAISTIFNLLFQYLTLLSYSGSDAIYIAMFFGTLAGLVSKYILDKKYIFYHTCINKSDNAKKFVLYSFMGIFTTAIFWITELGCNAIVANPHAKYLGAVAGLTIGYTIKYFLDKKYVFIHKQEVIL
ncbi:GtrA family protein [Thiolapillus brandeum]|uniref:GtrA family protein n=1 Tax=Thiolapillus brandeum TaxID=1076588 RepID=A0A7U6GKG9_9GAMM|nr:GtrA family protein [Thiolapillus brandeum]BAO45317.1 conserved hypothetical protein [Thiolapillus brandeum]